MLLEEGQISWLKGRNEKKKTPYIAFTLLEQLFSVINNRKISRTLIVQTTWNFPSVHKTLLRIG